MRRISSIRSGREAELEKRREELRDIRWRRRRNMMITVVSLVVAVVAVLTEEGRGILQILPGLLGF
jgi:hypothetical protein